MELTVFEPETAPSFLLPSLQEVVIVPLGDIQAGAAGCDLPRLKRHIAWALETFGDNLYFLGMGDYLDVASPSNRKAIYRLKGDAYDSVNAMMDRAMDAEIDKLKKILAPTRGRWLGLIRGHHEYHFPTTTSDAKLAEYLGCPLLGHCALIHLILRDETGRRKAVAKLWIHHGVGAGVTLEAGIRKIRGSVVPYWFANAYLVGHYHQKSTTPVPWIDTVVVNDKPEWVSQSRYIISTGSFLKGYQEHSIDGMGLPTGDYVEKAMLPPNVLGGPVVFIRPKVVHNRAIIDINVSV